MKERWGIENLPSGSHEPSMNQSYKICCQMIKGRTNTPKKNWVGKGGKKCPVTLGPVLICVVKLLCKTLLDACIGLAKI